ncbi:MAG: LysR family transcriptional regulator [Raoultibacter sp.]
MNLSQLYYFKKLAELEHYANAAKELYITQPSLTHAIKSLESELGVPLFERAGRRVKLSAFGKEFNEYVKRGLQEIDKGIDLAKEYNSKLTGCIDIGAIYTVQGDYLPALIRAYHEEYGTAVKFNLFQGFSLPLIDGLERDEYDLVFVARPPDKPNLCFEHVVSHELVVGMTKDNPLASRKSLSLEDLRGHVIYTYRRGTPIGEEVADLLAEYDLCAVQDFEDEITLGGMVLADTRACGLMTLSIGLKSFPDLAVLPLEDVPKDFHRIYMTYKRDKFRNRAVESFLEFTANFVPPKNAIPRMTQD